MKHRNLYRKELEDLLENDSGVMVNMHTDSPEICSKSKCHKCRFSCRNGDLYICCRKEDMVDWLDSPVESTFSIVGKLQLDKLEYEIRNFKSRYNYLPDIRANQSTFSEINCNPTSTQLIKLKDNVVSVTKLTLAIRCNHVVDDSLDYGEIVLEMPGRD